MSFELAHQNNKATKGKASTNVKSSYPKDNSSTKHFNHSGDYLQRTIDGHAAQRLVHSNSAAFNFGKISIHPKLKVNDVGDIFDQESVRIEQGITPQASAPAKGSVKKLNAALGGECVDCVIEDMENLGGVDRYGGDVESAAIGAGIGGIVGAAMGPTLNATTTTPKTDNGCGGYVWAQRWGLSGANSSTNGFVVQQLTFDLRRTGCGGTANNFYKRYWEAWEVRGGKIFVGTTTTPHSADTFRVSSTPNHHGINHEEGKAKFIPGYTAPSGWGSVPEAGSLPATETQPAGWSTAGTLNRSIRSTFNCCEGKNESTLA